jgi:hypothetical protein
MFDPALFHPSAVLLQQANTMLLGSPIDADKEGKRVPQKILQDVSFPSACRVEHHPLYWRSEAAQTPHGIFPHGPPRQGASPPEALDGCREVAALLAGGRVRLLAYYIQQLLEKVQGRLGRRCRCRTSPYLNNIIEQDHRALKRRINAKQGFRSLEGAQRTIPGYEVMHMIRKGQVRWLLKGDVSGQILFINSILGLKSV